MDTLTIVAIIVIAVLAVLALGAFAASRQRTTDRLRTDFGPEYDLAVERAADRKDAEKELAARQERVEKLHIQPLSHEECNAFTEQWQGVQARFVDDPASAIHDADNLVGAVMVKRGYPLGDFEQRAADVSVDHPAVVTNYRLAHNISRASYQGNATTEEMRQAMQSYRSLFDDLLQTTDARR